MFPITPTVDEPIVHNLSILRPTSSYAAWTREPSDAALLQDYYGQLRENNWSLYTDFKGFVGARYDL